MEFEISKFSEKEVMVGLPDFSFAKGKTNLAIEKQFPEDNTILGKNPEKEELLIHALLGIRSVKSIKIGSAHTMDVRVFDGLDIKIVLPAIKKTIAAI